MKLSIISFFLIGLSAVSFAQPTGFIWPTDASPYLSSTFAETRSEHFHAGLDIKTWGREGYKVFASKSGRIIRMAITSQGYGRTLYMQHEDGTYTVYAHLQRFIPELQSYIDSVRMVNHQFEIDLNVESNDWYYDQGDVIGYTGSTGIGPPHLHFEIRDKNNQPINALLTDLEIKDTIAPKISAVLVIPMSDSTKIEGSKYPRIYYPNADSENTQSIGLIRANGPVGIAIYEYDQVENVTNRYSSYEFRIESEQGLNFYSIHDSFNFEETHTMFIDRIPAFGAYRRSYQTLFQEEDIKVPFYTSSLNNGILIPTDDSTLYTIRINDFYQNTTEVNFELIYSDFASIENLEPDSNVYSWYWRNDWLTLHQQLSVDLTSESFGLPWNETENQRLATFSDVEMLMTRIDPNASKTIISPDFKLKVHFNKSTFFDSTTISIFSTERNGMPAFAVMPHSTPIMQDLFVEYYLGNSIDDDINYQVYHYDPFRDKYTHVSSELIGNTLHAQPELLGEFVIINDDDAPVVTSPNLISTEYGEHFVEVSVLDELSGIDFERSEIQVNGIRGITEYDFEEDKLIFIHPDFKPESRNRIEVIVTDNAGNSRFEVFYR